MSKKGGKPGKLSRQAAPENKSCGWDSGGGLKTNCLSPQGLLERGFSSPRRKVTTAPVLNYCLRRNSSRTSGRAPAESLRSALQLLMQAAEDFVQPLQVLGGAEAAIRHGAEERTSCNFPNLSRGRLPRAWSGRRRHFLTGISGTRNHA